MRKNWFLGLLMLFAFSLTSFADVGSPPKFKASFELKQTTVVENQNVAVIESNQVMPVVCRSVASVLSVDNAIKFQMPEKTAYVHRDVGWQINRCDNTIISVNTSGKHENTKYRKILRIYLCS